MSLRRLTMKRDTLAEMQRIPAFHEVMSQLQHAFRSFLERWETVLFLLCLVLMNLVALYVVVSFPIPP
jgi:hypothetical protein